MNNKLIAIAATLAFVAPATATATASAVTLPHAPVQAPTTQDVPLNQLSKEQLAALRAQLNQPQSTPPKSTSMAAEQAAFDKMQAFMKQFTDLTSQVAHQLSGR